MKICFGILTCPNTKKRFEKFMSIHEKWFIDNGFTYYAIYGSSDPSLPVKKQEKGKEKEQEYKIVGNNFYCAANEAYEVLAHKLAIFYTYIFEKTSFDYVFKVDDGCLLKKDEILRELSEMSKPNYEKQKDYCGSLMTPTSGDCHKGKCTKKEYNSKTLDFLHDLNKIENIDHSKLKEIKKITYCGGGYGYRLSRNALQCISKYKKHIMSIGLSYEDVLIGQILFLENIKATYSAVGSYHQVKL